MNSVSFSIDTFSPEEIAELEREFESCDKDGSKSIDQLEFIKFFKKKGFSKDSAETLFYIFGTDDDDIDFDNFKRFFQLLKECENQQSERPLWKAFFDKLDADHNGSISFDEFVEFGKICCPGVSEEDLHKEFNSADSDKNGSIDFEELLKVLGK